METHRLVLPGDLNHFGFLFGGRLLAWIDEASWIAASLDYPNRRFVTKAMNTVEFHHSVKEGSILRIVCEPDKLGTTSVAYSVRVYQGASGVDPIFSTKVTFVCVDKAGNKCAIAS